MKLHIQPHPISADGFAGMCHSFLTELSEREALTQWCRKNVGGWFRLERLSDYFHGSALWQCVRPGTDKRYRFVVSRASITSVANSRAA